MSSYSVVIEGTTLPGFAPADVRPRLAAITKQSEDVAAKLLAGHPKTVKSGVDQATAMRYVNALREIGVACHLDDESVLALDLGESSTRAGSAVGSAGPSTPKTPGPNEKYCSACGSIVHKEAEICPKCGVRLQTPVREAPTQVQVVASNRSRSTAALLALFLGGIGVHKFYLGKASGIWYLVFCWTLIPMLMALVDGIGYLRMSDAEFARQYGGTMTGSASSAAPTSPISGKRILFLLGIVLVLAVAGMMLNGRRDGTTQPTPTASKPAAVRADLLDCDLVLYEKKQGKNFIERAEIVQDARRQGICK